jgi:hypothetical protein
MNGKNILKLIGTDKQLQSIMTGIVFCGVALVSLAITVSALYF